MHGIQVLAILAFPLLMTGCSSPNNSSGAAVNKQQLKSKSFHKIFVEVATIDIELRLSLENHLVARFASEGYAAVKSLDLIPFSLKELKLPEKVEIETKVKESECDAILIVSLFLKGESINYTPGTFTKANSQFLAAIAGDVLKKRGPVNPIPGVNIPASFSRAYTNFIVQSNLYNMPSEAIVFSGEPENFNIASLDVSSKSYAAGLVAQLKKEKLLKK